LGETLSTTKRLLKEEQTTKRETEIDRAQSVVDPGFLKGVVGTIGDKTPSIIVLFPFITSSLNDPKDGGWLATQSTPSGSTPPGSTPVWK